MQTRPRDVADFSPCSAVIFMPFKLDATERSMLILRCPLKMFCYTCPALSIHALRWIYLLLELVVILLSKC